MTHFIIRRLLQMIPILLGTSIIVFLVINMAPGDPFSGMINPHVSQQKIQEMRHRLCLDCPLPLRYWGWLKEAAQGNLGYSITDKKPVTDVIQDNIRPTLVLGITAELIIFLIGIPVGILSATRQNTWIDTATTVIVFAGLSVPSFYFGLLLLRWLSLGAVHLFPSAGWISPDAPDGGVGRWLDIGYHVVLPALALGVTGIAGLMRYVRSSMLEVMRQDFVRTARAKGLAEKIVIYKHALRNALIPVITLLGLDLPTIVGGAVITEHVFSRMGIGQLTFEAVTQRNYPVLMALNLMFAVLTLVGNLLADIGYALVDPRIRYD